MCSVLLYFCTLHDGGPVAVHLCGPWQQTRSGQLVPALLSLHNVTQPVLTTVKFNFLYSVV